MGKNKYVIKLDVDGNVIKTYNSCKDASKDIGVKNYTLSRKIKRHEKINNFYYEYSDASDNHTIDFEDKIKCPYCDFYAKNYNGLCKHVFKGKIHKDITKEQLLTDVKYNGIRPRCKCGCGGYTTILYENGARFADYIQGHWNSVNNNWGHNVNAQEKSAKTRREQYSNGTRVQWNKGKKWDETYDVNKQTQLRNNLIDKLNMRVKNSSFRISSNIERKFIEKYIKPYIKDFKTQYYLSEIKQFCDIFIPELNLIIEINGTYWHCDRRIYNNGPINNIQEEKIKKDCIKYSFLHKNKYRLLVIWEYDIINNCVQVENLLKRIFSIEYDWKKEINDFINENAKTQKIIVRPLDLLLDSELEYKKEPGTIYVFEDEWFYKKDIVKSRLLNQMGVISNKIYARKCNIQEISYKDASYFLMQNHLQGKISGYKYIGLFYQNKLVSLMVFGKLRKNLGSISKEGEYELLRFCSCINTNVIGAASKLFKYFIKTYRPKKIISYSDKRYGEGEFYEKIGMKYSHDTQNSYFYIDDINFKRNNRFAYRKDVLVKIGFDKNKTEKNIMIERGIRRINDLGCKVFYWE